MPRVARIVLPGLPHHIIQRGNNRQDVFFVDADRTRYLKILREQCALYGLAIEGFCLMTNHIHLIATPEHEDSLAKAVGRTHFRYTQYVNRLHRRSGHLWQNRFYSCAMDEAHFFEGMRYVECNPVRARMVRAPWRYPWSSAAQHTGDGPGDGTLQDNLWRNKATPAMWKDFLREHNDEMTENIRLSTSRGRPLATDSFLSKLERRLNRRLRPLPVGRPTTTKKK